MSFFFMSSWLQLDLTHCCVLTDLQKDIHIGIKTGQSRFLHSPGGDKQNRTDNFWFKILSFYPALNKMSNPRARF